MCKNNNSYFFIGVFNGIVITLAFLLFLVRMDEEFHYMDSDNPLSLNSPIFMDLSYYDLEDIENEYFKRQGPENIMDILLHQYSMAGTIWENKWDSISDVEKVGILLNDKEIADRLNHKKKRKNIRRAPRCNNLSQDTFPKTKEDSCYILTRNQKIEE